MLPSRFVFVFSNSSFAPVGAVGHESPLIEFSLLFVSFSCFLFTVFNSSVFPAGWLPPFVVSVGAGVFFLFNANLTNKAIKPATVRVAPDNKIILPFLLIFTFFKSKISFANFSFGVSFFGVSFFGVKPTNFSIVFFNPVINVGIPK